MLQYMWTIPCLGESGEWMKAQGSQAPWEVTAVAEERAWSGKRGWGNWVHFQPECHVQGPHTGQAVWVTSGLNIRQAKQERVTRIYHKVEAHLKWVRSSFMISSQLSIKSLFISENFTFITALLKVQPTKISWQKRKVFVLVQEKKKSNLPLLSLASSSEVSLLIKRAVLHL